MDPVVCFSLCFTIQLGLWLQMFGNAYTYFTPSLNLKQQLNLVSVVHNLGCVALGLGYGWTNQSIYVAAMGTWSASYFLVDSMNYPEGSLLQLHHYASLALESLLIMLYRNPTNINGQSVFWGLFWCEISNMPMYCVYHFINASPPRPVPVPKWLYTLEFLQFTIFRTLCAIYFLWVTPVTWPYLQYAIAAFWLTSMHWARGMWNKI